MNDPMKYVVVDYQGCELPVIFDPILSHQIVSSRLEMSPISAGMIRTFPTKNGLKVFCWGESITLKKGSRPEIDAKLIEKRLLPDS